MHSKLIGYILWIFGFMGAHRFYYGKPVTGTIWFFTLGLFLIGWIVDLFLIPSMDRQAAHPIAPTRCCHLPQCPSAQANWKRHRAQMTGSAAAHRERHPRHEQKKASRPRAPHYRGA